MVGHALILWGFIMFLPDTILGHIPLVIGTIWSFFSWFGVDRPCRDDESCFDITGFHHVFAGYHTGAYHLSYLDRLKWVVDGMDSCQ